MTVNYHAKKIKIGSSNTPKTHFTFWVVSAVASVQLCHDGAENNTQETHILCYSFFAEVSSVVVFSHNVSLTQITNVYSLDRKWHIKTAFVSKMERIKSQIWPVVENGSNNQNVIRLKFL